MASYGHSPSQYLAQRLPVASMLAARSWNLDGVVAWVGIWPVSEES